jgi:hypothetical protein
MQRERKRVKNGEYYTLISATVLFRTAFFLLTAGFMADETFLYVFYDLGLADFLLVGLLADIITAMHFRGKTQAFKTLSVIGTALFAVVFTHRIILYFYDIERLSPWVVRAFMPLIVYIIPVGFTVAVIFAVQPKKAGAYLKYSLLKPAPIVFFLVCFMLVGLYIIMSVEVIKRLENFDFVRQTMDDFDALLEFGENLNIWNYALNSLLICGTVLCFYRGARLENDKITLL